MDNGNDVGVMHYSDVKIKLRYRDLLFDQYFQLIEVEFPLVNDRICKDQIVVKAHAPKLNKTMINKNKQQPQAKKL